MSGQKAPIRRIVSQLLSLVLLDRLFPGLPAFRGIKFGVGSIANQTEQLFPASRSVTPNAILIERYPLKIAAESETFDEIGAHIVANATVFYNRRFSPMLVGRNCILPERREPGPWDFGKSGSYRTPGSVMFQSQKTIGFRSGFTRRKLSEALYIGTRAPDNYYHWLINALPALHLANNSAIVPENAPVLIPEILRTRSQLVEALELVANTRPIEYFRMSESIHVRRLFIIDPPPVYDTPLSRNQKDRRPLTMHRDAINSFRDQILRGVGTKAGEVATERLFLLRPKGDPRAANQEELLRVSESFGFRGVSTEMMSFVEQVELFSRAKFITGPSGAAFTNILFSSKAKVLIYMNSIDENENFFALLASVGGGEVFSLGAGLDQHKSPRKISLIRYRQALSFLLSRE